MVVGEVGRVDQRYLVGVPGRHIHLLILPYRSSTRRPRMGSKLQLGHCPVRRDLSAGIRILCHSRSASLRRACITGQGGLDLVLPMAAMRWGVVI